MKPILAMFPQKAKVLPGDDIFLYTDPKCMGNKALYLLIGARINGYFQHAIK